MAYIQAAKAAAGQRGWKPDIARTACRFSAFRRSHDARKLDDDTGVVLKATGPVDIDHALNSERPGACAARIQMQRLSRGPSHKHGHWQAALNPAANWKQAAVPRTVSTSSCDS